MACLLLNISKSRRIFPSLFLGFHTVHVLIALQNKENVIRSMKVKIIDYIY